MDVLKIFQMDEPISRKLLKTPNSKSANVSLIGKDTTPDIGKLRKQLFHHGTDTFLQKERDDNSVGEGISKEKMIELTKRLKDIEIPNNENRFCGRKLNDSDRIVSLEQQIKTLERKNQELESELMKCRQNFIRFQDNDNVITEQNNKIKQLENQIECSKEKKIGDSVSTRELEYQKVMMDYETFLVKLLEEKDAIQKEKDSVNTHLANLESAFNQLMEKYERAKQVVVGFKINEKVLKKQIENWRRLLSHFDQNSSDVMLSVENAMTDAEIGGICRSNDAKLRSSVSFKQERIKELEKQIESEEPRRESMFAPLKHTLKKRMLK